MIEWTTDFVVVGAGAAGLAAAVTLCDANAETLVIEARDRAGGRAYTIEPPTGDVVELGPEFIHGNPPETFALLRETDTVALDPSGESFAFRNGRLGPGNDGWEVTKRVLERVDPHAEDVSIDELLARLPDAVATDEQRVLIRRLLEGFDAADTRDASAIALAEEWGGDANSTSYRPSRGYGILMRHLTRRIAGRVRFGCVVDAVEWGEDEVTISGIRYGQPFRVHARRAVITLPLGVLAAGVVRFTPALPASLQSALDAMAMGPVVKLVLDFDHAFWETADGGVYRDGAFFQNPANRFATFWTLLPKRLPRLTAWAGGSTARPLVQETLDTQIAIAIAELQTMFPQTRIAPLLRAAYAHDWQADPFSRGAYSYLRVGGGDARARLGEPVGSLIFAGEAAATGGESGTIAGALRSGTAAARRLLGAPAHAAQKPR